MDPEFPQRAIGDNLSPQPVALLGGSRSSKKPGLVGDIWLLWDCSDPTSLLVFLLMVVPVSGVG